jgi:GH24 family phage-related lysozyme (muramidase)
MAGQTDYISQIKKHEGSVPHMYLCTEGYVTVGIGNMLPFVLEAQRLPFINRETSAKATAPEIQADYESVAAQAKGKRAGEYKAFTKLDLPDSEIDSLFEARVKDFECGLRSLFSDYDKYPESARYALLDMIFSLGSSNMKTNWPKLTDAVKSQDWTTAAEESYRSEVQKDRNDTIKKWLEEAAAEAEETVE